MPVISLPAGSRIWLVAGVTDMRNGFNGLASRVQNTLRDDPFTYRKLKPSMPLNIVIKI